MRESRRPTSPTPPLAPINPPKAEAAAAPKTRQIQSRAACPLPRTFSQPRRITAPDVPAYASPTAADKADAAAAGTWWWWWWWCMEPLGSRLHVETIRDPTVDGAGLANGWCTCMDVEVRLSEMLGPHHLIVIVMGVGLSRLWHLRTDIGSKSRYAQLLRRDSMYNSSRSKTCCDISASAGRHVHNMYDSTG